ncbi:hypothetical protein KL930_003994 [Ogataea haglerorum]|uniref:Uncharacterized protein n=1 Tax=Ogataea haglerorum TaxID=1937702 RepID=A0AAN6I2B5_9ASCO|nr:uncharacterized protein KL911_001339 [Ogataea haglerorum]KAG7693402.1 hypothetical protein KL915_004301 [Ogataea haglerorum]KAG7694193.1 hypothetical protein KL951_004071 [Ogataea haglerorum]KAG7711915.1 hypothetical protein KL914_000557 [Ogataea haglerorum]KAG7712686.1 hypothetical protein KL950_000557 [Ogataea haglerorum]KAG7722737.1 hypothetical protein KL913_000557 [Ogataea haglerorum]
MIRHFARQALCAYRNLAVKGRECSSVPSRHAAFSTESGVSIRALLENNLRPFKTSEVLKPADSSVDAREDLLAKMLLSSQLSRTHGELQEWNDVRNRLEVGFKGESPTTNSGAVQHPKSYKPKILSRIDMDENYRAFAASGMSAVAWDPQTDLSDVFLSPEEREKAYELFKFACQGQGFLDESVRSHVFNLFMYGELARLANTNHLFITETLISLVTILHWYSFKSTYSTFMIALHNMKSSSARRRLIGHIQKSRLNSELDSIHQTLAKEDLLSRKIGHQYLLENANVFDEESSRFILAFLLDVSPNLAVDYFNKRYVFGPRSPKLDNSTVEVFVEFFVPRKRYKELFNVFFFIERNLGLRVKYHLLHTLMGMTTNWSSFPDQRMTEPLLLYYHYLRNRRGFKIPKSLDVRINERLKAGGGYDKTRALKLIKNVAKSNSYRLTI